MIPRRIRVAAWATCAALVFGAKPAAAASVQRVNDFGTNPSGALMYIYVPDQLAAAPPVLVVLHYCTGTASTSAGLGYNPKADQYGFIVVYPEALAAGKCWDVHSDATLKHGNGGDSASIVSMVNYTVATHGANAARVYVTGTSSGAMMTNVLLGAYPDVFRAGAPFAGVPYGCFAGAGEWNSACADGQTIKTAQQWGDLARAAYPGYTGPHPRVQIWHGSNDETLDYKNFGETIKQWTNVLGVSDTASTTEQNQPRSTWVRTRYEDRAGFAQVEAVSETGQPHSLTVVVDEVVRFFGLDSATDPGDGAGGDGAGGGGAGGAAGSGTTGGAAGSGGAGNGGASGGSDEIGGSSAVAGTSGSATGVSGASGSGGAGSGAGGTLGNAGVGGVGQGGTSGTIGSGGTSGSGTGGTTAATGRGGTGGSFSAGGSSTARGGSAGSTAPTAGTRAMTPPSDDDDGYVDTDGGCRIGSGRARGGVSLALMAGALGMLLRRRRPR